MGLRYFALVLLPCLICPVVAQADEPLPEKPEDPAKIGVMTPAAKSELTTCVTRAAQSAGDDRERRAMVGVFIGPKGRAVSLAILESSGLEDLDKRVLRCVARADFTPAAPNKPPVQWIFRTLLKPKRASPDSV